MSQESNLTVDTLTLSTIYNNDYTIGLTGTGFTGPSDGLTGANLALKGYVDYVFTNNQAAAAAGVTGLKTEILAGVGQEGLLGSISTQYDTIQEIANSLLSMGDTGTTGTTLYNILAAYSVEYSQTSSGLIGLTGDINVETARAIAAETTISNNLSTEISDFSIALSDLTSQRENADSIINANLISAINTRTTQVSDEAQIRYDNDILLQQNIGSEQQDYNSEIASEAKTRTNEDIALDTAITDETNTRTNDLTSEQTTRENEDTTLTNNLNTEISDFTTEIANEQTTRENEDTTLTNNLDAEINTYNSEIASEAKSRDNADAGLTGSIEDYKTSNDNKLYYMDFSGQTGVTGNYDVTKDIYLNSTRVEVYSYGNVNNIDFGITGTSVTPVANNTFLGGYSVSANSTGTRMVVGVPSYNMSGQEGGAFYVYDKSGSTWNLTTGPITRINVSGSQEGYSVAMSGDGNTIAIGAPGFNSHRGNVDIYRWDGSAWDIINNFIGDSSNARFGSSVSVSYDGSTIVAGSPDYSPLGGAYQNGGYRIISISSNGIIDDSGIGIISDMGEENHKDGTSVSISGDGNTIAIGGPGYSATEGRVSILVRTTGNNFVQQGSLLTKDPSGYGSFGRSVSLSHDGNVLAVGASGLTYYDGDVSIFNRSGSNWTFITRLEGTNDPVTQNSRGRYVSLSPDAKILAVGGPYSSGAVWLFQNNGNNSWSQLGDKIFGSGSFGSSVFVSQNKTLFIGAPGDIYYQNSPYGRVFIKNATITYSYYPSVLNFGSTGTILQNINTTSGAQCIVKSTPDGNTVIVGNPTDMVGGADMVGSITIYQKNVSNNYLMQTNDVYVYNFYDNDFYGVSFQGGSVAISKDGNTIVFGAPDYNSLGAISIYTRTGIVWSKLQGISAPVGGGFGMSVAITPDASTIVVGSPGENSSEGKVYTYILSSGTYTQEDTIAPGDGDATSQFGQSVDISGDGKTISVGGIGNNYGQGAVWVFTKP